MLLLLPISQGCSSTASLVLRFHLPFRFFPTTNVTIASQLLVSKSFPVLAAPAQTGPIPVFQSEGRSANLEGP